MTVSIEKVLKTVAPNASPVFLKASVNAGAIMAEYAITSNNAQCQLVAQLAHECVGFTRFEEGMSYSVSRLTVVWPKRFPSAAAAQPYARNPRALANKVYNGRMGNREGSDDGWNFRGSGPPQHTGASEFARVERRTKASVTTNPSLLRDPANADLMWRAACSFFADRKLIPAMDRGDTTAVTVGLNGGKIGLHDRKILVQRAEAGFMGETIAITAKTTHEQAADLKRKAKNATIAAPAGGAGSGGATKSADQSNYGTTTALIIGAIVFVIVAGIAIALWRKLSAKTAEIETTELNSIDARLSLPPVAA